ncbi:MAG: ABC transporter substrate-binding protein [Pseudomonadota bacterium]
MPLKNIINPIRQLLIVLGSLLCINTPLIAAKQDKSIEMLHWWTSGSEATAINVLKKEMIDRGYHWKDSSIIGGDQQRLVLRARINAHKPPDAILIQGNIVQNYAASGLLTNLDTIALTEKWNMAIPEPLQKIVTYQNHWMAVPINIHRSNWIWANKKIFDKLKIAPPKTFDELIFISEKIRRAGYIPLAHGGQSWQDAILFDNAVLSVGGVNFYKQALIDLNPKALNSKTMQKAFDQLKRLRGILDKDFINREWNLATAMVIHEKAAMQIMGDWVKGEFVKAGKKANQDFLCFEYPGTQNSFLFISDLFGMLNAPHQQLEAQTTLASVLMNKKFQESFNLAKGSIPARTDINMENFDDCGKKSYSDFSQSLKLNTVQRRFDTAIPNEERVIILNIVSNFLEKGIQTPEDAVKQLQRCLSKHSSKEGFITFSYEGC